MRRAELASALKRIVPWTKAKAITGQRIDSAVHAQIFRGDDRIPRGVVGRKTALYECVSFPCTSELAVGMGRASDPNTGQP